MITTTCCPYDVYFPLKNVFGKRVPLTMYTLENSVGGEGEIKTKKKLI